MKSVHLTYEQWKKGIAERYPDRDNIEFVCPVCGFHQTFKACKDAGMNDGMIGFSCIGRVMDNAREAFGKKGAAKLPGPCNYAGGGLFQLNPVIVLFQENGKETEIGVFDVVERPFCDDPQYAVSKPPEKKEENA